VLLTQLVHREGNRMSDDAALHVIERQALEHRNRAEELRTVGENALRPETRRILLNLADSSDRLAAELEASIKRIRSQKST
jgi:hypothetical protein